MASQVNAHKRSDFVAPATSNTRPGGVLDKRVVKSTPPPAPRTTCKSSFFAALKQGGLHHWLARAVTNIFTEQAARAARPAQATLAIGQILKLSTSQPANWAGKFNEVLADAAWYEVEFDREIDLALWKMTYKELEAVKSICGKDQSLNWLKCKIDDKLLADKKSAESTEFVEKVRLILVESAMLGAKGWLISDQVQKAQWGKMDELFSSVAPEDLIAIADKAVSESSLWVLLPLAINRNEEKSSGSHTLEVFRRQVWEKIKRKENLKLNELNEVELNKFKTLVKNPDLNHQQSSCKVEIQKRASISKCNDLEKFLEKQISSIITNNQAFSDKNRISGLPVMDRLTPDEISRVALKVIAKADPENVITLSKLENDSVDGCLTNAAKLTLKEWTNVDTLDQDHLIAYLKMPETDIPPECRKILLQKANARVEEAIETRYSILREGFQSGSSDEIVHAVWQFFHLASNDAALESAVGIEQGTDLTPEYFSNFLENLDDGKFMRVKKLRLMLRDIEQKSTKLQAPNIAGNAEVISPVQLLSRVLLKRSGAGWVEPTERDNQLMAGAVARYFIAPSTSRQFSGVQERAKNAPATTILEEIEKTISLDDSVRTLKDREGAEIPVCYTFMCDQDRSVQEINGRPVFSAHISDGYAKSREFVRQMKNLTKNNEEQIMMASRLATQAVSRVVPALVRKNRLFSLTDQEIEKLNVKEIGSWLHPKELRTKQNFEMNENGNLIANVRIFNDNTSAWMGEIRNPTSIDHVVIETDPQLSHFSLDLTFEIDRSGRIKGCVSKNFISTRSVITVNEEANRPTWTIQNRADAV